MFADQSLTPKEAVRLAALGTLALRAMSYPALAIAIRHFVDRVIGPSPELMGHSIELLRYEGLIERQHGCEESADDPDSAILVLTDAGWRELSTLLLANVRPAETALNKLVVALKFRFLHLLPTTDQISQLGLLCEVTEQQLARLEDLRQHHIGDPGYLVEWLDHDLAEVERRLEWLAQVRSRLN